MSYSDVFAAVRGVTANPYEQAAMLYACGAESDCRSIQNMAGAPAYGPWQIFLPYNKGVTAQQANDPAFAAQYMYTHHGVTDCVKAQRSLWTSAPATAALNAARCIEGATPAEPYSAAQQANGVAAMSVALANPQPGAATRYGLPVIGGVGNIIGGVGGTIKGAIGGATNLIPGVSEVKDAASALGAIAGLFAKVLDTLSNPDFYISVILVFAGLALAVIGVISLAEKSPTVQVATQAAGAAAMAA